jgi:hypothetical protein
MFVEDLSNCNTIEILENINYDKLYKLNIIYIKMYQPGVPILNQGGENNPFISLQSQTQQTPEVLPRINLGPTPALAALERFDKRHRGSFREQIPSETHIALPIEMEPNIKGELRKRADQFAQTINFQTTESTDLDESPAAENETSFHPYAEVALNKLVSLLNSDIEPIQTYGKETEESLGLYYEKEAARQVEIVQLIDGFMTGNIDSQILNQGESDSEGQITLPMLSAELWSYIIASTGERHLLNKETQKEFCQFHNANESDIAIELSEAKKEILNKTNFQFKTEHIDLAFDRMQTSSALIEYIANKTLDPTASIRFLYEFNKIGNTWSSTLENANIHNYYFELPLHNNVTTLLRKQFSKADTKVLLDLQMQAGENSVLAEYLKDQGFDIVKVLTDEKRMQRIEHWETLSRLLTATDVLDPETQKNLKFLVAVYIDNELERSVIGISSRKGINYERYPRSENTENQDSQPNLSPIHELVSTANTVLPSDQESTNTTHFRAGELQGFIRDIILERFPGGTTFTHNAEAVILKQLNSRGIPITEAVSMLKYFFERNPVEIFETIKGQVVNIIASTEQMHASLVDVPTREFQTSFDSLSARRKTLLDYANALTILTTDQPSQVSDRLDQALLEIERIRRLIDAGNEKMLELRN